MNPRRQTLRAILEAPSLAFAGARRDGKGFGHQLLQELLNQGFRVVPVHPEAPSLAGQPCVPIFADLPGPMPAIIVLPPAKTLAALEAAADAGLRQVWLQQGSESPEALRFAEVRGLEVITGACLFMYLPQVRGFHRFHRGLWRLLGRFEVSA